MTVSYGPDPLQTIDVYRASKPNAHTVVLVHGGGWSSSVKTNDETKTARGLQKAGFAVFFANYRSSSDTTSAFPMEIDDIANATQFVIRNASTFNANPARVTLLGGSSGGQLVAMAAERLDGSSPGAISSVVTLSGPFDFPLLISHWLSTGGPVGDLHLNHITDALGCASAGVCPVAVENQWSPDKQVNASNCPGNWLIVNETSELMPVEQAKAMTAALHAAGCTVSESIPTGTKHSFKYWKTVATQVDAFISAN